MPGGRWLTFAYAVGSSQIPQLHTSICMQQGIKQRTVKSFFKVKRGTGVFSVVVYTLKPVDMTKMEIMTTKKSDIHFVCDNSAIVERQIYARAYRAFSSSIGRPMKVGSVFLKCRESLSDKSDSHFVYAHMRFHLGLPYIEIIIIALVV